LFCLPNADESLLVVKSEPQVLEFLRATLGNFNHDPPPNKKCRALARKVTELVQTDGLWHDEQYRFSQWGFENLLVNPVPVSPQPPGALLPRWANEQDSWIRAVVGDVLTNGVQCPDGDIGRYLKHLLAEKRLSEDPIEFTPKLEERQVDRNPLDPVRLDSLTVGDGVNAIKIGSKIDFAPSVTVIFGENGSGKSGFVRILKRAAGVRTAEDILHNVLGSSRPIPSATFSVTVGSNSSPVEWQNELGIVPLNRSSIFDARGARLHVEEDLSYVYTPGELAFFPIVQNAIERVRTAFEQAITTRTPGANALLASFERACSIYSTIETLGPATDINDIRKFALLPDNVDSVIESLKAEIDALKSTNIQIELRRALERTVVVDSLRSAVIAANTFDIARYESLVESFKSAAQRQPRLQQSPAELYSGYSASLTATSRFESGESMLSSICGSNSVQEIGTIGGYRATTSYAVSECCVCGTSSVRPCEIAPNLPPRLLRLLPAGATVAGWGSHPLKDRAFARRTA
jgi:hypothetical protein